MVNIISKQTNANSNNKEIPSLCSGSPETEPIACAYVWKEVYFKGLAHMIMEAGKSKICGVDQQAGDPGRS